MDSSSSCNSRHSIPKSLNPSIPQSLILLMLYAWPASAIAVQAPGTGSVSVPGYGGQPVTEGTVQGAESVRLFYRVVGRGADTVVLLHGGPGSGMREGYDLEQLTESGYTLVMYDQRGTGQSELVTTPSKLTIAAHVADLEAVRRHFGLRRLSLIGLSWGAAIALHYAVAYPSSVDRIVFLSPTPPTGLDFLRRFARLDSLRTPETRARLRAIDSLWSSAPDSLLAPLCRESLALSGTVYQEGGPDARGPRGDVCAYPADVLRNRRIARIAPLSALGVEYDFAAALGRVSRPVLVIEGEKSRLPLEPARFWAQHPPNARLLLIPKAGHRAWLDRPSQLFEALDEFLQGDWPQRAEKIPAHE
jgi:proline iminopeptidase